MTDKAVSGLSEAFVHVQDPRVQGRCRYSLIEVIVVSVCATLAGANTWTEIETFGKSKIAWLREFMPLKHGIPSHDTLGRIFAMIDAEEFQRGFIRWVEGLFSVIAGEVLSIDGKTARRSHDKAIGKDAIHVVSAWASETGIVLAQQKVDGKSNEITAIPQLLQLLRIKGCLVTIDAIGCQKAIAQTIRDKHADYMLAVKANQPQLHENIKQWFGDMDESDFDKPDHDYCKVVNKSHGRIETRECWMISDPMVSEYIGHDEGWAGLRAIVRVKRNRQHAGRVEESQAYYITSLKASAERLLSATRQHWGIENSLHWVMDVIFQEDQMRARKGNSAENLIALRKISLNILKQDKSKGSLRQKRYRAALDDNFRLKLLSQI